MTELKKERRRQRFIAMLARQPATVLPTGDPGTLLLEFSGERKVRISRDDCQALLSSGSIEKTAVDGAPQLRLTDAGRARLRREQAASFAGQHASLRVTRIDIAGKPETVVVNDRESPLAAIARIRKADGSPWLDAEEIAAGEKSRTHFEQAMLQPRVTSSWDPSRSANGRTCGCNGVADFSDGVARARAHVNRAIEAVGPELADVVLDICCFLKGIEDVEREHGWPRRSAKLILKIALGVLARHYNPAGSVARRQQVLHWGTEVYRPSI